MTRTIATNFRRPFSVVLDELMTTIEDSGEPPERWWAMLKAMNLVIEGSANMKSQRDYRRRTRGVDTPVAG